MLLKEAIKPFLKTLSKAVPFKLSLLARIHATDKLSHGYIPIYERYFSHLRVRRMNILEIGIGGYKSPIEGGGSLKMWSDYFLRSNIYGIDLYDKSFLNHGRIKTFKGSQCDIEFMTSLAKQIGAIDIIIDDGSHVSEHVIASFNIMFPYLSEGGYYVVEDLHTSYWPQFGGAFLPSQGDGLSSMEMLKTIADGLNYQYIPKRKPSHFDIGIEFIHFYPSMAVIRKGLNIRNLSDFYIKQIDLAASAL